MTLAISRMEERWSNYKQIYNSIHGDNMFDERYGYVPVYDSDDEDEIEEEDDDDYYETE